MFGLKHRGKLLPFTFSDTAEDVEIKYKDAVEKATQRLGDKVNNIPEAFDDRHDHICDLTQSSLKDLKNE